MQLPLSHKWGRTIQLRSLFSAWGFGIHQFWLFHREFTPLLAQGGAFPLRGPGQGYGAPSPLKFGNRLDDANVGPALQTGGFRAFIEEDAD